MLLERIIIVTIIIIIKTLFTTQHVREMNAKKLLKSSLRVIFVTVKIET